MKLNRIKIEKLFGELDHAIDLSGTNTITFIIGRNGSGKTTILRAIDSIANGNWIYLRKIQFDLLELSFDNNKTLSISKSEPDRYGNREIIVDLIEKTESVVNEPNPNDGTKLKIESYSNTDELIRYLIDSNIIWRLDCGHYASKDNSHMTKSTIKKNYGKNYIKIPEEIHAEIQAWNVRLLSSERLLSDESIDENDNHEKCYEVEHLSNDLKNRLQDAQSSVLSKMEEIGDALEISLLTTGLSEFDEKTESEFNQLLSEYSNQRSRIEEAELSAEKIPSDLNQKTLDPNEINLISYLIEKRLEAYLPYSELLFQIELFNEIVNSALSRKSIKANINEGVTVTTNTGDNFHVQDLSSGEQHVLILAHSLLFAAPEDCLILIDEPEISMDIEWQSKLSGWLEKIGTERSLQFLLATHSPLLINGRTGSVQTFSA